VKLYITASPEVRAERRARELGSTDLAAVLAEIRSRDARDSQRATAPLVPAKDAVVIDTSAMGVDEALQAAIAAATVR
jgi:cytidylate kinase